MAFSWHKNMVDILFLRGGNCFYIQNNDFKILNTVLKCAGSLVQMKKLENENVSLLQFLLKEYVYQVCRL